jgi:hypothetical protein
MKKRLRMAAVMPILKKTLGRKKSEQEQRIQSALLMPQVRVMNYSGFVD